MPNTHFSQNDHFHVGRIVKILLFRQQAVEITNLYRLHCMGKISEGLCKSLLPSEYYAGFYRSDVAFCFNLNVSTRYQRPCKILLLSFD